MRQYLSVVILNIFSTRPSLFYRPLVFIKKCLSVINAIETVALPVMVLTSILGLLTILNLASCSTNYQKPPVQSLTNKVHQKIADTIPFVPGVKDDAPAGRIINSALIQDAVPRVEPRTIAGNKSPYNVLGRWYKVMPDSLGYEEIGLSSWYGTKFHGRATSNGEIYDLYKMTAAHKTLPIPT